MAVVEAMAFRDEAAPGALTDYDAAEEMPREVRDLDRVRQQNGAGRLLGRKYSWDGCVAVIRIRADQDDEHFSWAMTHEFGHAILGPDHSDEGNVVAVTPGWGLTFAQVLAVRS